MKATSAFVMLFVMSLPLSAAEMTHQLMSPSFNGAGFSSHALTIYNMELTRRLSIATQKKADLFREEQDAANTPIARFLANLESRVFNELARQMVDRMFSGDGEANQRGSFTLGENTIDWFRDGNEVVLNVTDVNGTLTTIRVPLGDFGWIPPA